MIMARDRLGTPWQEQKRERRWFGLLLIIREGDEWPCGYGFAWREPWGLRAVCAPIPLNWVLGVGRNLLYDLVSGPQGMQKLEVRMAARWHRDNRKKPAAWVGPRLED